MQNQPDLAGGQNQFNSDRAGGHSVTQGMSFKSHGATRPAQQFKILSADDPLHLIDTSIKRDLEGSLRSLCTLNIYFAHGALVTLICAPAVPRGPAGRAESSDTRSSEVFAGTCRCLSGPLEYGIPGPGGAGMRVACAHGAAVAPSWWAAAVAAVAMGWFAMCMLCWGAAASGFVSQENSEPKGKCCTTGNLERTSALNILIMPCL